MRDVKFRGWDSENKKWRHGHFFETVEGIMRCYNIVENREVKFYCSPQSIGQFTGIQDVNGKDIYEGDVLIRKKLKYIVEWSSNLMWILTDEKGIELGMMCEFSIDMYEIVGNIYENPELLS